MFIGTTNNAAYLRDETGGRRFWPVGVGMIDVVALARDRDQLLAEAMHLYRAGQSWWPNATFEREFIRPEQDDRYEEDAWQGIVADYLERRLEVTITDIAKQAIGIDASHIGTSEQRRIAAILDRLGWERGRRRSDGRPWVREASERTRSDDA